LVFNGSKYHVKPCNVGENETSSGKNEEMSLYSFQGRLGKTVFWMSIMNEILKKYKE
jgi:hypothetical protein